MPVSDPIFAPLHRHTEFWSDDNEPDIMHLVCDCNDDIALCGTDVSGEPWNHDSDPDLCVVCADLDVLDCQRCGL